VLHVNRKFYSINSNIPDNSMVNNYSRLKFYNSDGKLDDVEKRYLVDNVFDVT